MSRFIDKGEMCKCGHERCWHVGPNGVGLGSGPACHCGCDCFVLTGPMGDWFTRADRDVHEALVQVLTCTTGLPGDFMAPREICWGEFNRLMTRLTEFMKHRHAAKHAAMREAIMATPSMVIDLDKDVIKAWKGTQK